MIVIRNLATGEMQVVASMDGIDLTAWVATEAAAPTDMESRPYQGEAGELVAIGRAVSLFDFLSLWTPDETLAVLNTGDALMAYYWVRAQASPTLRLGNPLVIAGVQRAVDIGVLDAARAAAILSGIPPA